MDLNKEFKQRLDDKEAEHEVFLTTKSLNVLSYSFDVFNDDLKEIKAQGNDLYIFKDKRMVFWTNNDLDPAELIAKGNPTGSVYIKNSIGYYLVTGRTVNDILYFITYKFYNRYSVNNEFFSNSFNPNLELGHSVIEEVGNVNEKDTSLYTVMNKLPGIDNKAYHQERLSWWSVIFYFFSILLFVLLNVLLAFESKIFHFRKFTQLISLFFLILIVLIFFDVILKQKDRSIIFQPEIAAYNRLVPSLGHSILFSFGVIFLLIFVYQSINNRYKNYVNKRWHYLPVSLAIWFSFYILLLNVFPSFVLNSQVNFDFTNLANINYLTLISMFAIFQFFLITVIYFRILSHTFNHQFIQNRFIIYHFIVGIPVFLLLYFNDHVNGFLLICFFALSLLVCYQLLFPVSLKVVHVLFASALFSAFIAVQFDQLNSQKEHEQRKIFANKFIAQEDLENETALSRIESDLIKANIFTEFFNYERNDYNELELNYKYAYFADYIKNYDIDFLRYDSLGAEITQNNFSFTTVNDIYNKSTHKSISNYFLFIRDVNYLGGYLAKYEICPAKKTLGYVFILLVPKIKSDLFTMDYFFNKKENSGVADIQYSFAVYQNKELIKSIGSFPFKLKDNRQFLSMDDETFYEHQEFSHLLKKIDQQTFLIVSRKANNWQKKITELTSVFLIFIGILIAGYLLLYLFALILGIFKNNSFIFKIYASFISHLRILKLSKLYLETKIRIAFLLIAVFICSAVSYFTVQNVNSSFNEHQNEELDKKMSQIVSEIEIGYQRKTERSINTLIKHLANTYEVDINLFKTDGTLFYSGNDKIYSEGWFSPLMNSRAFFELSKNKQYNFKQTESIGKLSYLSNYNALFNENRKLIGYVHLPYFAKSMDLKKEFSKYLGSLLNISTFLLLLSLVAASYVGKTLVKPLKIMINRISQIRVGERNTPIEWHQNDEIGQLVDQYNLMLKKLEISTEKLAQSEREGAWKEMAKQVAHEIKNPLTPMKLHLQHLQFAISRQDEDLPEKVRKISNILIEQIDHLSKMAEEFSSFAQMPIAIMEVCNIRELMLSSINLFKGQSGININHEFLVSDIYSYVDKGQLQRVFTNILKNAQQAAHEVRECHIEVKLWVEGDLIHISFSDNGHGIEKDLADKIFMPNFSTKTSGMGLGLSICKKIIESFEGTITFESEPNIGTTFYVTLPNIVK